MLGYTEVRRLHTGFAYVDSPLQAPAFYRLSVLQVLKAGLKAYEKRFERLNGRRPLDVDKTADGVADYYRRFQEVRLLVPKKGGSSTPGNARCLCHY